MISKAPLILTLKLDAASAGFFEVLRQQHFPAERNYLRAHLTLFHHLPGAEEAGIVEWLQTRCRQQATMTLEVTAVKNMGRGVAFKIESEALAALHKNLQRQWQDWLTAQDKQKLWPHVTVQNKVQAVEAAALQQKLATDFEPFRATGEGLQLWAYQNGPWELLHTLPFKGEATR